MLKVVNGEAPKPRKLILGFDAGCGTCADLAAGVQEKVGDKLEVQNLNDPQLMAWREEALGKDAKWTPTLFEVEGEKVLKAWAGWRMGYALSRKLGPSSTWQVMQALGEAGGAPKIEESPIVEKLPEKAAEAISGISRSQFLKGAGGAAIAMSILSGTGLLASPAEASTRNPSPYDSIRRRRLAGSELMRTALRSARSRDVINVVGSDLSTVAKVRAARPKAARHTLRNGVTMLAISYILSADRIVVYEEFSRSTALGDRIQAKVWRRETRTSRKFVLVKGSEGGVLWRRRAGTLSQMEAKAGEIVPLGGCPDVGPPPGGTHTGCWGTACCRIDT